MAARGPYVATIRPTTGRSDMRERISRAHAARPLASEVRDLRRRYGRDEGARRVAFPGGWPTRNP